MELMIGIAALCLVIVVAGRAWMGGPPPPSSTRNDSWAELTGGSAVDSTAGSDAGGFSSGD